MKRLFKTFLLLLLAALLFLALAVGCFEITIPRFILTRALDALSTSKALVCVDEVTFRLSRGVRIRGLRVLDREKATTRPIISAEQVNVHVSYGRFPWTLSGLVKEVVVKGLSYPRLPEGYYIPDSIEFPGHTDFKERNEALKAEFPLVRPFRLVLENPNVLGIRAARVESPRVTITPNGLRVEKLLLTWPLNGVPTSLSGGLEVDLPGQQVRGLVHGQTRQSQIRPLLVALEITNSYRYIDAFTGIEPPVDADCAFGVNLRNDDLHLALNLHPSGGFYNRVPLKGVNGPLDINVFVRDTYQNARILVGPLVAEMTDGGAMTGSVLYENTNDIGYVTFDVKSTTSLSNALAVADVFTDGTLDVLQPRTLPKITLEGLLAVRPEHAATNDLHGTIAFESGTLFSIPLRNASAAFAVKGTDVTINHARAAAEHGGTLDGSALMRIPGFRQEGATFSVTVKGRELLLPDLAGVFGINAGDRTGYISGTVTLEGPFGTNLVSKLTGRGHLDVRQGHLSRMPLFMGLTDYLAQHVPGLSQVVDQSQASLDFTINKGVFATDNLVIEGGAFSIQAKMRYDMAVDNLTATVRVQFFRTASLLEKITRPLNWSLSKLLMEFRVKGSLSHPEWEYADLMNRLWDSAGKVEEKAKQFVTPK